MTGKLITFEGTDGSGKTTQIAAFAAYLRERGHSVLTGREPGGTSIGDQVRDILHALRNDNMDARTEFLLYAASRAQIVHEVLRPALALGQIVLLDRYIDSTFAYQGYGRGLDLTLLRTITHFATGGLVPDLTIFLSLDPAEGVRRRQQAAAQGAEWTRMDAQAAAFYERVGAGYESLIAETPDRFIRVNAALSIAAIQTEIRERVGVGLKL